MANVNQIEIVTDILSTDAVKIPPNAKVIIKRWGGNQDLLGEVYRIEPGGFTKISALGVEEQRVNVITRITSPKEEWKNLKAGFQLDTEIVLYSLSNQLLVPVSALFRDKEQWAVFKLDGSTARVQPISVKDRNPEVAIVAQGLVEGDQVIIYPGDRVKAGVRVTAQN